MREARIILPIADNSGTPLNAIHAALAARLVDAFGGATVTPSYGLWRSPSGELHSEAGKAYDIAADDDAAEELRAIAVEFGDRARQEAVYFRRPDGIVEIIDIPSFYDRAVA